MLTESRSYRRSISIDPSSRGFGFAVLEDGRLLVDWGLVAIKPKDGSHLLRRFTALLERYTPQCVVLECVIGSRRAARSRDRISVLEQHSAERLIEVIRIAREDVRRCFPETENKYHVAIAIVDIFPELSTVLPPKRKPWMTENPRMRIFGAVALGLAACSTDSKGSGVR